MSFARLLDSFSMHLRHELNRSPLTVGAYSSDLKEFSIFLSGNDAPDFDPFSVTSSDIRLWLRHLSQTGVKPVSLRRKTQSLRAFYHFLMKKNLTDRNPADDIVLARTPRKLPNVIREEEMEFILKEEKNSQDELASENPDYEQVRDHLIINMLYSSGLRRAELLSIRDADINMENAELKVTGKRNKQRIIPLPPPLLEEIFRWQQLRDSSSSSCKTDGSQGPSRCNGFLFPGRDDKPISKSTLYNIVKRELASTSSGRPSPHTLRHTFATAMLNDGASLDTVREMLGHSSLAATQIYTHVSITQLKDNYRKAHPRAQKKQ